MDWLKRRLALRGYGVHSPLGFRLVKHVMRPPRDVIYYAEERLDASSASSLQKHRARILLRFVAEMQPSFVWTHGNLPEIYREAISGAGCVIRIFDSSIFPAEIARAGLVVVNEKGLNRKQLEKCLQPGKSLIAFGVKPSFVEGVIKLMKGGVVLEGRDSLIAVSTADEALHLYSLPSF